MRKSESESGNNDLGKSESESVNNDLGKSESESGSSDLRKSEPESGNSDLRKSQSESANSDLRKSQSESANSDLGKSQSESANSDLRKPVHLVNYRHEDMKNERSQESNTSEKQQGTTPNNNSGPYNREQKGLTPSSGKVEPEKSGGSTGPIPRLSSPHVQESITHGIQNMEPNMEVVYQSQEHILDSDIQQ